MLLLECILFVHELLLRLPCAVLKSQTVRLLLELRSLLLRRLMQQHELLIVFLAHHQLLLLDLLVNGKNHVGF